MPFRRGTLTQRGLECAAALGSGSFGEGTEVQMGRGSIRKLVALGAGVVTLLGFAAPGAEASKTLPLECLANGAAIAHPTSSGTANWTVDAAGTCTGDFSGTYTVSLHGTGTSNGLSQCTGDPIMQDFSLAVDLTISNLSGTRTLHQTWSLPVDNYSVRTPFLISGQGTGAGYIGHNIFLACPGNGSPSASFLFSFLG